MILSPGSCGFIHDHRILLITGSTGVGPRHRRLGPGPAQGAERRDLLEVIEDRHQSASMLVTSQLPVKAWYDAIGDPTLADAICDRLIPGAHKIHMKGPSMRQERAKDSARRPSRESS